MLSNDNIINYSPCIKFSGKSTSNYLFDDRGFLYVIRIEMLGQMGIIIRLFDSCPFGYLSRLTSLFYGRDESCYRLAQLTRCMSKILRVSILRQYTLQEDL